MRQQPPPMDRGTGPTNHYPVSAHLIRELKRDARSGSFVPVHPLPKLKIRREGERKRAKDPRFRQHHHHSNIVLDAKRSVGERENAKDIREAPAVLTMPASLLRKDDDVIHLRILLGAHVEDVVIHRRIRIEKLRCIIQERFKLPSNIVWNMYFRNPITQCRAVLADYTSW